MTTDEFKIKVKRILMNAKNIPLGNESAVSAYLDGLPFPDGLTFGGDTPCLEISEGKHQIIIDCGSGMRLLGRQMMKQGLPPGHRIDILQTHTHWDHMMGFPFFAPAYAETDIHIHGVHPNLSQRFEQQMDRVHFPITMDDMRAKITFHQLKSDEEFALGPFVIKNKALNHPGGSYTYRITSGGKSVVFATDGEYKGASNEIYQPFVNFYMDADILIFDAMYLTLEHTIEKENYGHSTAVIGVDIAVNARVKNLVLFHHDPECDDNQIARAFFDAELYYKQRCAKIYKCPLTIVAAYDGLTLDV
jgi:phosphoribosyl 1,2-cyclic phosphodiesterase